MRQFDYIEQIEDLKEKVELLEKRIELHENNTDHPHEA